MIDETDVAGVAALLDQVAEVLTEVSTENAALHKRAQDLEKKVLETERLALEKVAAARQHALDPLVMGQAVDFLVARGIIHPDSREKIARSITQDPNNVFGLLTKVSEALMSAPSDGAGIPKETPQAEADPDGWGIMARGGMPKLRP